MLHTKYQGYWPCGFRLDYVFIISLYEPMLNMWTQGRGHFWLQGHNLNKLRSAPLGDATYPGLVVSDEIFFSCFLYIKCVDYDATYQFLGSRPSSFRQEVLLLWIFYVFSVLRLLCLCARLFVCALWSSAGKGLTSWLLFVVSCCEFDTFPLVSWVRCGIWLYRFLIFAPLLTFKVFISKI